MPEELSDDLDGLGGSPHPAGWRNRRAIILLFIANSISGVAQGISMIAIPWYFTQAGDTSRFGYLYAGITFASMFWGPYSGTLVDRYNRKRIFLILNLVMGLLLAAVAAYGFRHGGVPWGMVGLVYLLTFLNYNLHYPNLYAFVQEITEREYYGKITSYLEVQGQLASVLAGAGAALLLEGTKNGAFTVFGLPLSLGRDIAPWGIHQIFLLDAATYLVSFGIISAISYQALTPRKEESGAVWQRIRAGFGFLQRNRPILIFGVASYSIFVCVLITVFYNNPIYVEKHLLADGGVFASSEMYYAVGAVFAGAAIRRVFNEKWVSIPVSIIIMMSLSAGLFFTLQWGRNVWLFYGMMLLLGITNSGTRIQRVTYLFRHVPNQFYGRAGSIFFLSNIFFRIGFLSLFALPFFQTDDHIRHTMGIMGLFLLLSVIFLIMNNGRIRG